MQFMQIGLFPVRRNVQCLSIQLQRLLERFLMHDMRVGLQPDLRTMLFRQRHLSFRPKAG